MTGAYLCIFSNLEVLSFVSSYSVKPLLLHRVLGRKFKIRYFCPIFSPVSFFRALWNTTVSRHFQFLKIIRPNRVKPDSLFNLLTFVSLCLHVLFPIVAFLTSISCLSNYQSHAPSAIMKVVYEAFPFDQTSRNLSGR